MLNKLYAIHGTVIASEASDPFGYYAWPTVARTEDGCLWVAASGMRNAHICPWGKTVLLKSGDNGCTWSPPIIINNSMIDDRDCGLIALPNNRLFLSWFTSDTRRCTFVSRYIQHILDYRPVLGAWEDTVVRQELGSFVRTMEKDGSWSARYASPVSAPHGPMLMQDGTLLYLGRTAQSACYGWKNDQLADGLDLYGSGDEGMTWTKISHIDQLPGTLFYCEPHILELKDGRLLAMIRLEGKKRGERIFSMLQMESSNCGKTWTEPHFIAHGSPPHLLRHSSGLLICTYGWRQFPGYGQRVIFSQDEGQSWSAPWILRDDAPNDDLGYPSTVELADGSLFTVYYQHPEATNLNCALLWSRWCLPAL